MSEEHSKFPRLSDEETLMLGILEHLNRARMEESGATIPEISPEHHDYINHAIANDLVEKVEGKPWEYEVTQKGHYYIDSKKQERTMSLMLRRKEMEIRTVVDRVSKNGTLLDNRDYGNALAFPRKTGNPISSRASIKEAALTMAHNYKGLVETVISRGLIEVDPVDGWQFRATEKGLDYLRDAWTSNG